MTERGDTGLVDSDVQKRRPSTVGNVLLLVAATVAAAVLIGMCFYVSFIVAFATAPDPAGDEGLPKAGPVSDFALLTLLVLVPLALVVLTRARRREVGGLWPPTKLVLVYAAGLVLGLLVVGVPLVAWTLFNVW